MVDYLLGNFMVNLGIISAKELERVLDIQDKVRVKLGLIAVSQGYMTVEQADEINFLQTVMNKRFGDIAIEKGFITEVELQEMLDKQGSEYLAFVQTLVDEGIIVMEEMEAIIKGFQKENDFTDEQMEAFKSSDIERIVEMFLPAGAVDFKGAAITAVNTVIRCIDRHAYIKKGIMTDKYEAIMPVSQELQGRHCCQTTIADISGGMCLVATVFGRMPFDKLDEDTQDACAEFLNCVNGLYASDLSRDGMEVELMPPEFSGDMEIESDGMLVLPICIDNRELVFIATKK